MNDTSILEKNKEKLAAYSDLLRTHIERRTRREILEKELLILFLEFNIDLIENAPTVASQKEAIVELLLGRLGDFPGKETVTRIRMDFMIVISSYHRAVSVRSMEEQVIYGTQLLDMEKTFLHYFQGASLVLALYYDNIKEVVHNLLGKESYQLFLKLLHEKHIVEVLKFLTVDRIQEGFAKAVAEKNFLFSRSKKNISLLFSYRKIFTFTKDTTKLPRTKLQERFYREVGRKEFDSIEQQINLAIHKNINSLLKESNISSYQKRYMVALLRLSPLCEVFYANVKKILEAELSYKERSQLQEAMRIEYNHFNELAHGMVQMYLAILSTLETFVGAYVPVQKLVELKASLRFLHAKGLEFFFEDFYRSYFFFYLKDLSGVDVSKIAFEDCSYRAIPKKKVAELASIPDEIRERLFVDSIFEDNCVRLISENLLAIVGVLNKIDVSKDDKRNLSISYKKGYSSGYVGVHINLAAIARVTKNVNARVADIINKYLGIKEDAKDSEQILKTDPKIIATEQVNADNVEVENAQIEDTEVENAQIENAEVETFLSVEESSVKVNKIDLNEKNIGVSKVSVDDINQNK